MKIAMRKLHPVVIGFMAFALHGATITVAPSGGDYATLETAVAAASDGDEIIIENGTYTRTGTGLYVTSSGRAYNNTVWASAGNTAAVTNDAVNAGGTLANTAAGTLATSSGTSVGNAVVSADAFQDDAADDFRPRRTSGLFNAGDSSLWSGEPDAVDLAGNRRVRNGRVDAGAYEFGDLPSLFRLH